MAVAVLAATAAMSAAHARLLMVRAPRSACRAPQYCMLCRCLPPHANSLQPPVPTPLLPPQQPGAAQPSESAGGSELLRELRNQNKELQRVRQQLEATQQKLLTAPAVAAPAAAPVAAPVAAPAAAPVAAPVADPTAAPAAAPAAAQDEEEEGGGSAFAALNLVGILAAGGLYGYSTIQKKQAAEAEAAFQSKLAEGALAGGGPPEWEGAAGPGQARWQHDGVMACIRTCSNRQPVLPSARRLPACLQSKATSPTSRTSWVPSRKLCRRSRESWRSCGVRPWPPRRPPSARCGAPVCCVGEGSAASRARGGPSACHSHRSWPPELQSCSSSYLSWTLPDFTMSWRRRPRRAYFCSMLFTGLFRDWCLMAPVLKTTSLAMGKFPRYFWQFRSEGRRSARGALINPAL